MNWHFEQRIDLKHPVGALNWPDLTMVQGDHLAHEWRVWVNDGGAAADLSGYRAMGYFMRSDGITVPVKGDISGNKATVVLPQAVYACKGPLCGLLRAERDDQVVTLACGRWLVRCGITDDVVDPEHVLPGLTELDHIMAEMRAALEASANAVSKDQGVSNAGKLLGIDANGQVTPVDASLSGNGGLPTVYCWGDSLTQGYGGNISTGSNQWHAMSYPQEIGQRCDAINLGVMSEDVPTICARIGSNPILLPACTIPASHTEGVKIGNLADGLPTRGGRNAKVCRYHEAGVNPCWVGGVKCVLYRSYSASTPDTEYFLRRYADGNAVTVAEGTELETYGSRYYKGGIHIFWMGANYGFSSVQEYLSYLKDAIRYVAPENYLVVYARCFASGFNGETEAGVKAKIIAAVGADHFVDLLPALKDRGLLYGEVYLWDGAMTGGVPSPLDSGDGLHYSYAGYKAIAGVIWEQLQLLLQKGSSGSGSGSGDSGNTGDSGDSGSSGNLGDIGNKALLKNGTDDYGAYAVKLNSVESPVALSSTAYIDTQYKVYGAEEEKDCTIALAIQGNPAAGGNLLSCSYSPHNGGYADNRGLSVYCNEDGWTACLGSNLFGFTAGGVSMEESGTNVIIIRKAGNSYGLCCNGTWLYGNTSIGSDMSNTDFLRNLTLLIGATPTYPSSVTKNTADIILQDLRVYTTALSVEQVANLSNEMAAL